jgi:hypothetical protein
MPKYTMQRVSNVSEDYRNNIIMGKSNHSYALNNRITTMLHFNSWLNKRCFLIGGGESVKGFDFSKLKGELTIGINKAFKFFPDSTINYCMDPTFYDQMKRGDFDKPGEPPLQTYWDNYKGLHVFLTPMELKEFGKEVFVVKRLLDKEINREDLGCGIYQGTNSGTGAICLAAALGANPIYLMGYDMKAVTSTHWHEGYEEREMATFNKTLEGYRDDISSISILLNQAGIRVVNLNKDSDLKCFEFSDFGSTIGLQNANIS